MDVQVLRFDDGLEVWKDCQSCRSMLLRQRLLGWEVKQKGIITLLGEDLHQEGILNQNFGDGHNRRRIGWWAIPAGQEGTPTQAGGASFLVEDVLRKVKGNTGRLFLQLPLPEELQLFLGWEI